ncbi:MAG TPA: hypothetical protein VE993_10100 [Stellaceae bacterium]|nr:hypothetical protein [Stellaceae bacterium]
MTWRDAMIDSQPGAIRDRAGVAKTTNVAAEAVLEAFRSARDTGKPSVECYRAGVEAWRRVHPDQSPEYAAKQAVAVILATHAKLKVEE